MIFRVIAVHSQIYNNLCISQDREINMSCPMLEDNNRLCVSKFIEVINIDSLDICKSDDYKTGCPVYRIVVEKQNHCSFFKNCFRRYITRMDDLKSFYPDWDKRRQQYLSNYCFSDNGRTNCAIFKLLNEGEENIPSDLAPDGDILMD